MKPTVFNYQEYERVVEENKKLNAEVADLRIRIADGDKRDCKSCKHQKSDGCSRWDCEYEPRMDDTISRQDAIEAVATVTMSIHLSNVLCDKLLALPSADRPTGWIPCSERLPENSGCVLISIAGDIEFGAYDRQNSDWAIWRDGYWDEGKRADAWMPLPEPYREDGEACTE